MNYIKIKWQCTFKNKLTSQNKQTKQVKDVSCQLWQHFKKKKNKGKIYFYHVYYWLVYLLAGFDIS